MLVRLLIDAPGITGREVAVSCTSKASAAEVTAALCEHLGMAPNHRLWRAIDGTFLRDDELVTRSPLCDGDHVSLVPEGATPPMATDAGGLSLVVLGGSACGEVGPLYDRPAIVGRADNAMADVRLSSQYISSTHAQLTVSDSVRIEDLGSRNGTFVRGERLAEHSGSQVKIGEPFTMGDLLLAVEHRPVARPSPLAVDGLVLFNRPPRRIPHDPSVSLVAPDPPEDPVRPTFRYSYAAAPLVMGMVMYFILGQNPAFLAFMLLSPMVMIASFVEDRRTGRRTFGTRSSEFLAAVADRAALLAAAVREEEHHARAIMPHGAEIIRWIREGDERLWARRPDDEDFLRVRVGWGPAPRRSNCTIADHGSPRLRAHASMLLSEAGECADVPLSIDLRAVGALGVSGPDAGVNGLGRWLVVQLAACHSPDDVAIAVVVPRTSREEWTALAWSPHAESQALGRSVVDESDSSDLLQRLLTVLDDREDASVRRNSGGPPLPAVVLFLPHEADVDRGAVATLMDRGPSCNIYTVWLGDERERLPSGCRTVIALGSDGTVAATTPSGTVRGHADGLPAALTDAALRGLARYRDVAGRRAGGTVPASVGLLDLLDMPEPSSEAVLKRWSTHAGHLAAPVGATADGPFMLDLGEGGDGPHGVIGGSPGSGKSVLLQSLLLAFAATHSPKELNILIIDWKGEGAATFCRRLPHTAGVVTSLDGSLERAVSLLEAEWRLRDELFNRYPNVDKLEKLWAIDPAAAPPYLLIVVDEFAEVQRLFPDTFKAFASLAALGRSRGARLLLATQRPGAAVGSEIGNIDLRIALRMNEAADSKALLDVEDAARLQKDLPGRGYAKSGRRRLVEFQSAFIDERGGERRTVTVRDLRLGRPVENAVVSTVARAGSPLDDLVESCTRAWAELDGAPSKQVFTEPLPELLSYREATKAAQPGTDPLLGLVDLPEQQRCAILRFDAEAVGPMLVYGGGGSGKSTVLRTLAAGWCLAASPDDVHLYGIDGGTRGLDGLRDLPHTGAIVNVGEDERMDRLFRMLRNTVAARKELFADARATLLSEYHERVGPLPRIVVLLDGLAAFLQTYENVRYLHLVESLPGLLQDGRVLGVHWVITVEQALAARSALSGAAGSSLILRHTGPSSYPSSIDARRAAIPLPPGRGFLDAKHLVQVAVVGRDPSGSGQRNGLESLARWARERWPGLHAPPIGILPAAVVLSDLPAADVALRATVGIGDNDLAPVTIDLLDGPFFVAGPRQSGRSTALAVIATALHAADPKVELVLTSPRRTPIAELGCWTQVLTDPSSIELLASGLRDRGSIGVKPMVLMIDDADELNDGVASPAILELVRRGSDSGVFVVATTDTRNALRAFGGFLPEIIRRRHGLILQPDGAGDGDLLGITLPRSLGRLGQGRGVLARRGEFDIVQFAQP